MARPIQKPPRQGSLSRIATAVTLAWWQLRLTWRLLLVVGAGVMAAAILVCAVPLYSQVALSAGLRDSLATPGNSAISVHSVAYLISQPATEEVAGQIRQQLQQNIGPFLAGSQFSVQSPGLQIGPANKLQLIGWSMDEARAHVRVLQGRLPGDGAHGLEIALTPQSAAGLHLDVGSTFSVPVPFFNGADEQVLFPLSLHVVGIFLQDQPGENFWHGTGFASQALSHGGALYPALVSNDSYLAALDAASRAVSKGDPQNGTSFANPCDLYWYYNLDLAHLDVNRLGDLASGLNNLLVSVSNQPVAQPFVDRTTSNGPSDLINGYSDRVTVARVPLLSLSYLVAGLLLFFISLMADLLVERQAEAIAVLRGRGASREQVIGALLAQCAGVGTLAFAAGPLLAILLARGLAQISLSPHDQAALNVILAQSPLVGLLNLYLSSLATVVISILAIFFAINHATRVDRLAQRQEATRAARRPVWVRMSLDILAGVIALTGYGLSAYVTSRGVLDARARVLILPPMTLVGAVFLLIGCMLLFLRIFPFILEGLAILAMHVRGATSLLAVTQMARTPRHSLRMTLLLALAVAFGIFSLVFRASQEQRIPTVAAYQVGANFNGTYPAGTVLSTQSLARQEQTFARIPGVRSACVGYLSSTRGAENGINAPIELRAVDADAFARTALWSAQDSSQPLDALTRQLIEQRNTAISQRVVPAIVDAAAWKTLGLAPGSPFTLSDLNGTINYIEVAEVDHIPTINDSSEASGTGDYVALGGVLVDFTTYRAVVQAVTRSSVPLLPTTVWLNTKTDAGSLSSVRTALSSGPLHLLNVNDLQAQESAMSNDPLSLALLGTLMVGAAAALLLGLVGNMAAAWLNARNRWLNFAVMRALGTPPGQLAGVLTCEQMIVYATAIGLGVAFGLLLSYLVLPAFVFTSAVGNAATGIGLFYIIQSVPPIQMIVPGVLIALVIGILVAVCVVALGGMALIVSRPNMGSILRLQSDE